CARKGILEYAMDYW
nr:immunoglobulin heavy chain junction region [Mus musculus]MBK4196981.1 immunoglobulin heavy chain junction region [Mus musculus]